MGDGWLNNGDRRITTVGIPEKKKTVGKGTAQLKRRKGEKRDRQGKRRVRRRNMNNRRMKKKKGKKKKRKISKRKEKIGE